MTTEQDFPEAEMWDEPDAERIYYHDLRDAVRGIIDVCFPDYPVLPQKISLFGYKKMKPHSVDYIAKELLEHIDLGLYEEYGDPDNFSIIPETVLKAARKFAKVVHRDFPIWAMEPVCSADVTVNKVDADGNWEGSVTIHPGYPHAKDHPYTLKK